MTAAGRFEQPQFPKIAVGVMVHRQGRILLGKRRSQHQDGRYSCPGGHVEMYESLRDAAIRELHEECGTGMMIHNLRFVDIMDTPYPEEGKHYFVAMFVAEWALGLPWNQEPDKCEGWNWFPYNSLPNPLIQGVQKFVEEYGPEVFQQ